MKWVFLNIMLWQNNIFLQAGGSDFSGILILILVFGLIALIVWAVKGALKNRKLLIQASEMLKVKNKELDQLQKLKMPQEVNTNQTNEESLRKELIDLLSLSDNSKDSDIIFYIKTLLKENDSSNNKKINLKEGWMKSLSRGNTHKTLEDITSYLKTKKDEKLLFEVIEYSNRFNSMSNLLNKGVIKIEEFNIETSKINSAIIDFVRKL